MLDHCSRFGKRVLVASTSEVYGDHREELPLDESARRIYGPTTVRRWAYADSKAMDEFLALAYHQERGLDCVIVRLFNTVGPRQSGMYGMVIPRFVERALANGPLEIHGDGTQTRCFCHVQDTVRALRRPDGRRAPSRARSSTSARRNGSGSSTSPQRVLEATGSSSELEFVPYERCTDSESRTCSTASRRSRRSRPRSAGRPSGRCDEILADVIAYTKAAPALAGA